MRKKLFAIVMSMTMVASFMPSMAFAANTNDASAGHTYFEYGKDNDYIIVDGKAVTTDTNDATKEASQKAIDKFVKVVVAPTCTTKGKVELTCNNPLSVDGVACDQVVTKEVEADHTGYRVNMSLEAYANQLLAQKDLVNEGQAKTWVKTQKALDACYVSAYRCKSCGEVAAIGSGDTESKIEYHAASNSYAKNTCAAKVPCANTGCTVKIDNPYDAPADPSSIQDDERQAHKLDSSKATTVITGCSGVKIVKTPCKNCDYVDEAVDPTLNTPNCVEFKGEIPSASVRVKNDKVLYNGKVIATISGSTITPEEGYFYDSDYKVYIKADTTKVVDGTEYHAYTCKHCGYVAVLNPTDDVTVLPCTHNWSKVTDDATCTDVAMEYMVCSECGKFKAVTDTEDSDVEANKNDVWTEVKGSKALGHALEVKVVPGDCHDTARYEVKCTRPGCTETLDVDASDFQPYAEGTSLYVNPADATLDAITTNISGSVELKYLANNAADTHKFTKKTTIKAATCENNELVGYVCDDCGKINVHSATIVPGTMLAHDVEKVETPATCKMTAGSIEKCKNCDYEKVLVKAEPIKGGEHTGEVWKVTKAATVFEEGVKTLVCPTCGDELGAKTVIAKKTVAKASNTVTAGKKSLTVKSSAANATGYRVYYKKAGAKSWKSYTKKTTSLSKTFSGLSKGKYYVKVRAYAKNYDGDGQVVWGATSSTKSVKVK